MQFPYSLHSVVSSGIKNVFAWPRRATSLGTRKLVHAPALGTIVDELCRALSSNIIDPGSDLDKSQGQHCSLSWRVYTSQLLHHVADTMIKAPECCSITCGPKSCCYILMPLGLAIVPCIQDRRTCGVHTRDIGADSDLGFAKIASKMVGIDTVDIADGHGSSRWNHRGHPRAQYRGDERGIWFRQNRGRCRE